MPFEKKLNIIAANNYFDKKKEEYEKSNIAIAKELSSYPSHNWSLDDISTRNIRVTDALLRIFASWDSEYDNFSSSRKTDPTPEQLRQIEEFRRNGWV